MSCRTFRETAITFVFAICSRKISIVRARLWSDFLISVYQEETINSVGKEYFVRVLTGNPYQFSDSSNLFRNSIPIIAAIISAKIGKAPTGRAIRNAFRRRSNGTAAISGRAILARVARAVEISKAGREESPSARLRGTSQS